MDIDTEKIKDKLKIVNRNDFNPYIIISAMRIGAFDEVSQQDVLHLLEEACHKIVMMQRKIDNEKLLSH